MAMGRSGAVQDDLMATWAEMPRSPGHAFYDRLQELLGEAGFDAFVEEVCKPHYAPRMGAPSLPPGRYFRMHMIRAERRAVTAFVYRCTSHGGAHSILSYGSRAVASPARAEAPAALNSACGAAGAPSKGSKRPNDPRLRMV